MSKNIENLKPKTYHLASGYAAITVMVITMAVSLTIVAGLTSFSFKEINTNRSFIKSLGTKYVAESGVEDAIYRIVSGKQFTNGEQVAVNGTGTTTISFVDEGNKKIIRSEGVENNSQQNLETRVDITYVGTNFNYGAFVGTGGLELSNNAEIQGSVYSNGNIEGDNGAKITGDALVAGSSGEISDVTVTGNASAHTFDNVDVGGNVNSYSFDGGTVTGNINSNSISHCTIQGNAAYNSKSSCNISGTATTPTTPPSDPASVSMPITDEMITTWKNDAVSGGVLNGDYNPSACSSTLGPKKVIGNLILDANCSGGQTLTITGNIWVTGHIEVSNNAKISLQSSYGNMSGLIIADGYIDLENNGTFSGSGTTGSYLMLLTLATGGGSHSSAINIQNNSGGAIFYAPNGTVWLNNGVHASELTGKKVHLENNAVLKYELELQDVKFVSSPAAGFDIKYWKEVE